MVAPCRGLTGGGFIPPFGGINPPLHPFGRVKPPVPCGFKFRIPEGSQPFFSEFEGAEDGSCFVLALFVFAGGDGVGHDAGSGLQVGGLYL